MSFFNSTSTVQTVHPCHGDRAMREAQDIVVLERSGHRLIPPPRFVLYFIEQSVMGLQGLRATQIGPRVVERHQLEGVDPEKRSFNRWVEIIRSTRGYTAEMGYEGLHLVSLAHPTPRQSLEDLVRQLQVKGFARVRTKLNMRGSRYLAEREPWVDSLDRPDRHTEE